MSINIRVLRLCSTEWKSSLNLAPEMFITKETKWHMFCQCYDISYTTGPILIKTKISRLETMCVPSKTLSPTLKGCKWGYSVFYRKIKFTNIWISLKCKKKFKKENAVLVYMYFKKPFKLHSLHRRTYRFFHFPNETCVLLGSFGCWPVKTKISKH